MLSPGPTTNDYQKNGISRAGWDMDISKYALRWCGIRIHKRTLVSGERFACGRYIDAYRSDFISGGGVGCVESECDRAGEQAMPDRTGEGGRCIARRR